MTSPGPTGRTPRPSSLATAPDPGDFTATWEHLAGAAAALDLLDLAADDGLLVGGRAMTIAGRGVAAVLELPGGLDDPSALREVVAWLQAVEHAEIPANRDVGDAGSAGPARPAPGAVAVGAFPFDRSAPAFLVVPAVAWCRCADGRSWRVTVSTTGSAPHGDPPAPPRGVCDHAARRGDAGTMPVLTERPPGSDYAAAVAAALGEIDAGRLSKVVLSRAVEMALGDSPRPSQILGALWDGDPAFSPFSLPVADGRLLGASPELIVSRLGSSVTSHPFAGTISLGAPGGDDPARRLFASAKDRNEHRLLVDEIASALRPCCDDLDVPDEPSVVPLRSDARLGSIIRGTLRQRDREPAGAPRGEPSALDLVALLHPTPAVGGVPRAAALDAIASLEPDPRGYWAGVTGWVDGSGDGEWVLAIRSVFLDGQRALVRAGAGIVDGSDPIAELAETTVKLSPVLDALWPGSSALV